MDSQKKTNFDAITSSFSPFLLFRYQGAVTEFCNNSPMQLQKGKKKGKGKNWERGRNGKLEKPEDRKWAEY
jgi:hypothetical protein